MSASEDPFFVQNLLLLKEETDLWQFQAKRFVKTLSEKFTKSAELEILQQSPPLFSDEEDYDPALADVINLNLNESREAEDELSIVSFALENLK